MIPKKKKIINQPEFVLEEFSINMCPEPEKDPYEGSPYTEWLDNPNPKRRRRR